MRRRVAQLASLDLNLILVLRELLRERNVTRAAERVGVTQPAVSAALPRRAATSTMSFLSGSTGATYSRRS